MEYNLLRDIIQWDIYNWSQAINFWENKLPVYDSPLHCLELGSRNGGLSLWLASKGNRVLCSDLTSPTDNAVRMHNKYILDGTITYEAIDATNIPYKSAFDLVVFKSVLGGISKNGNDTLKSIVIHQILSALKPGGHLLFAENLEASGIHKFFRKRFTRWGQYWNYLRLDEVEKLLGLFRKYDILTLGFFGAFGQNELQRNILGRLDRLVGKWIPDKQKYILVCIAQK